MSRDSEKDVSKCEAHLGVKAFRKLAGQLFHAIFTKFPLLVSTSVPCRSSGERSANCTHIGVFNQQAFQVSTGERCKHCTI